MAPKRSLCRNSWTSNFDILNEHLRQGCTQSNSSCRRFASAELQRYWQTSIIFAKKLANCKLHGWFLVNVSQNGCNNISGYYCIVIALLLSNFSIIAQRVARSANIAMRLLRKLAHWRGRGMVAASLEGSRYAASSIKRWFSNHPGWHRESWTQHRQPFGNAQRRAPTDAATKERRLAPLEPFV